MYKFVLVVCALLLAWPVTAQEKQGTATPSAPGIAAPAERLAAKGQHP